MATKKKLINYIPRYVPGTIAYVLAYSCEDGQASTDKDKWDWNFAKIFKIEIDSITIGKEGVNYYVRTPGSIDDSWNEPFEEEFVNTDKNVLVKQLLAKWKI